MSEPDTSERFMRRLVEGLAGWMGYRQAAKHSAIYSEHLIYVPLFEIALGRSVRIRHEKMVRDAKTASRDMKGKRIDFAFIEQENRFGIVTEVKFVRPPKKGRKVQRADVNTDIKRLMKLKAEFISLRNPPKRFMRYAMIVGRSKDVKAALIGRGDRKRVHNQFLELYGSGRQKSSSQRKADEEFGVISFAPGALGSQHCVAALREQSWWREL